jgi:hypothetical protein
MFALNKSRSGKWACASCAGANGQPLESGRSGSSRSRRVPNAEAGVSRWQSRGMALVALFLLVAACPLGAHAAWDVGSSEVAHWAMDDNATTATVMDACGEHSGALSDGSTAPQTSAHAGTGRVLGALDFDGTDDVVSIPDSGALDLGTSFTLSLWVQCDNAARAAVLLSKMDLAAPGSGWQLEWRGETQQWAVSAGRGGNAPTVYTFSGALGAGTWQFVTAVYDGSAGAGARCRLYVNGAPVSLASIECDGGGGPGANDLPVLLGAGQSSGSPTSFFDGRLDEIRIFSRALTEEEVAGLYNRGVGTDKDSASDLISPPTMTGIEVTARDRDSNRNPSLFTNNPLVLVFLRGISGEVDAAHLAENEGMTENPQDFWRPPLGSWDGGTTLTYMLSPLNELKTVWAMLSNRSGVSFPPTSASIVLDTVVPSVQVASDSPAETEDYCIPVRVTFSEPVEGLTASAVTVGGAGGVIESFDATESGCSFRLIPSDVGEVTVQIAAGSVRDRAGNANDASNVLRRTVIGAAPSLKAHLALDEAAGAIASDSSRYHRDGVLENGLLFETASRPGVVESALRFDGVNAYVSLPALSLNSNTATLCAWIKREGDQAAAGIVWSADGVTTAGLRFGTHNELRYAWSGGAESWDSGLEVPEGQWVLAALVVEPDKATIYMGSRGGVHSATVNANHAAESFAGPVWIGRGAGDGFFAGVMDDVQVFAKALSAEEIAEMISAAPEIAAPSFVSDPVVKRDAVVGWPYRQSLVEDVRTTVENGTLVFAKVSGPAWLAVAADGTIAGVPGATDLGANELRVRVRDSWGGCDEAAVRMQVLPDGSTVAVGSATSPAWVEGDLGTSETVSATIGGAPLRVVMENATRFYADNASMAVDGSPTSGSLGVALDPASATGVALSAVGANGATRGMTQVITWTPTDLTGRGATEAPVVIRAGDSLLLTATGEGALEVDANGDGTSDYTGASGGKFAAFYPAAGEYIATARVGGQAMGALKVVAVGANFDGPIACHLNFRREKRVFATPAACADLVSYVAADAAALEVTRSDESASQLRVKPLRTGKPLLQARLGGATGPIVGAMPIDVFTLRSNGVSECNIVEVHFDGSMIVAAVFAMTPLVRDLDIGIQIVATDTTFLDSGTAENVSSNGFTSEGTLCYFMLKSRANPSAPCHGFTCSQRGVAVGP